jgi:DNA helicase-2/ATP-dependent DNA helicase PcrA
MGVEAGVIPRPDAPREEERRLLYVAMTRARQYLYLTMARSRSGPTAYAGGGQAGKDRSRCPFFIEATLKPQDGQTYLASLGV